MKVLAWCTAWLLCLCGVARGQPTERFAFGMEYAFSGTGNLWQWVAGQYTDIGATWCKFNGPGTFWGDIEPSPPVDGEHTYDWSDMDEAVQGLQQAGFTNLTVVIGSRCDWGSEPVSDPIVLLPDASTPPKAEHWVDYAEWVFSFVERYDHDGLDDMPGLAAPIRYYEVLTEAQLRGYWQGTVEDYVALLRTSYDAAKLANPETQIILSGFWFADLFDDGPLTNGQVDQAIFGALFSYPFYDIRFWAILDSIRAMDFNRRVLREGDFYDAVEFHLLSNHTAVEPTADWLRREMAKNGYDKPIWIGDCGALPQIPCHNRKGWDAILTTFNFFQPALYDDGDRIFEVLTTKQDAYGYTYPNVLAWYYRDQASHLAKALIAAMANGLAGANVYTWVDGKVTSSMWGGERNWQIGGLREGGPDQEPFVGPPRPSFYTYKMIVDQLGGFDSAAKVQGIGPAGVSLYRFDVGGDPVYAAWYDDGPLGPGDEQRAVTVNLSSLLGGDSVEMTRIITIYAVETPDVETVSAGAVVLTAVPVLLR